MQNKQHVLVDLSVIFVVCFLIRSSSGHRSRQQPTNSPFDRFPLHIPTFWEPERKAFHEAHVKSKAPALHFSQTFFIRLSLWFYTVHGT